MVPCLAALTLASAPQGFWDLALPLPDMPFLAAFLHISSIVAVYPLVLVLVLLWSGRALTYVVARHRGTARGSAWRFAIAPAIGAATLACASTGLPLQVRWQLSRAAFAREATGLATDNRSSRPTPDRLGLYHVTAIQRHGLDVVFVVSYGFDSPNGFVYAPDGSRQGKAAARVLGPLWEWSSLGGGWYEFVASG